MAVINQSTHKIPLFLNNIANVSEQGLCETGIPIPQGLAFNLEQFQLECDGVSVDCTAKIISQWHDKSIKWLYISFFAKSPKEASYCLIFDQQRNFKTNSNKGISLAQKNNEATVLTDSYKSVLNINSLILNLTPLSNESQDKMISINCAEMADESGQQLKFLTNTFQSNLYINLLDGSCGAISLKINGKYSNKNLNDFANFELTLTFFEQQPFIKLDFSIHNPNAAAHPNGHWDLGDTGSIKFSSLDFIFNYPASHRLSYQIEKSAEWKSIEDTEATIEQYSSGGENWLSPVHLNQKNVIPHTIRGYQQTDVTNIETSGQRATPIVTIENIASFTTEQFWQNFPKTLYISSDKVVLSLFPKIEDSFHELQAGEKKTHTIWIDTNGHTKALDWVHQPKQLSIPLEWIDSTQSIYGLSKPISDEPISKLISLGLTSDDNFFEKRETLDEFGWRNFGDIYADHETAGYEGDGLFVSHYNNQYDPIFGFLKQYLLTGDSRWFELADDLAKHVKDIDIYHTKLDKNEYNGGLFWHTDHYLEAFTSSHRSYSKHQSSGAYQDHAGGGGPGGQHCYTTGLQLHHCLTGIESSKQAVLTLSQWITNVYEGSETCLELLLAFKNRNVEGLKNHFTGQYPLDRGTANYVIALLDSYELTQEDKYLTQVETILTNSMHPDEDLTNRNLQDVEGTWFYTVLLQALCRYLDVKQNKQELDNNFYYCRDCLLNFTDWMLIHEYPYLNKPDILEYPNDTWTAQDLRKAHVFAGAYYYSADRNPEYLAKAKFFEQYVADKLNSSDTKTYTRILVLLMQNHGAVGFYQASDKAVTFAQRRNTWPAAHYQKTSLFWGLCKVLGKRLIKLSLKNELDWLKKRLA